MEEERLWKFKKPEWLNSAWARNAGVYGAGGLVCAMRATVAHHPGFRDSMSRSSIRWRWTIAALGLPSSEMRC